MTTTIIIIIFFLFCIASAFFAYKSTEAIKKGMSYDRHVCMMVSIFMAIGATFFAAVWLAIKIFKWWV